MLSLLLVLSLQAPGDTVRLDARAALDRAAAEAGPRRAAEARLRGARAAVRAAGAWANPVFNATAENIGAQEEITGKSGLAGIEGQLTLQQHLTLGGDRGARVRQARAGEAAAAAGRDVADAEARAVAVGALAMSERDRRRAGNAAAEAAVLAEFARVLTRRAEEGRMSGGDAARARLEAATARSLAARRQAIAEESGAEVARLLGLAPGTPVVVTLAACGPAVGGDGVPTPELRQLEAEAASARAAADVARAARVPDLFPMAGLRRTAGFSGLLLGLSVEIPLLRSGAAAEESARAEAEAVEATRGAAARRLAAARAGSDAAAGRLEAAAEAYGPVLAGDLDRAVRAAEARLAQGEAALLQLLDARRARLALLDELAEWRAARLELRARRARLAGLPIDEAVLCEDRDLETR